MIEIVRRLEEENQVLHTLLGNQCLEMAKIEKRRIKAYEKALRGDMKPMDPEFIKETLPIRRKQLKQYQETAQHHLSLGGK